MARYRNLKLVNKIKNEVDIESAVPIRMSRVSDVYGKRIMSQRRDGIFTGIAIYLDKNNFDFVMGIDNVGELVLVVLEKE